MAQQQREDTPKTGPAPKNSGATLPERADREGISGRVDSTGLVRSPPGDKGHEEIGQMPDTGDFGPDDVGTRRA